MDNIDYQFESLNEGHIKELTVLFSEIFNKVVAADYFIIKYGLNIPEIEQLSTVLLSKKRVIGFIGVIGQSFNTSDKLKLMKIGFTGDFFLLEKYRKTGVFKKAYERSLKLINEHEYEHIYALHSDQTYKVCQRWGWTDQIGFSRFHLKTIPFSTSRIINKAGLKTWRIKQLEKRLIPFSSQVNLNLLLKEKDLLQQNYDAAFFEMKAFCTHYLVEIEGCILFMKYDYLLTIGFVHFTEYSKIDKMLNTLKRIARKSLIHDVVFHLQGNLPEAIELNKYLKEKTSFKISSLKLQEDSPEFSSVRLNFMDMDVF